MSVILTLPSIKGTNINIPEMEKNLTDLRDAVNLAKLESVKTNQVSYTLSTKQVVLVDATAGGKVMLLPASITSQDITYIIKKIDASTNTVQLLADGSDTIEGSGAYTLNTPNQNVRVICNGTNWYII